VRPFGSKKMPIYRDFHFGAQVSNGKLVTNTVDHTHRPRRLAEAIWHMLSRGEPFAPKGATDPLAA
jgi:hypothetical protein